LRISPLSAGSVRTANYPAPAWLLGGQDRFDTPAPPYDIVAVSPGGAAAFVRWDPLDYRWISK
jgi:hypothetical protein